MPALMGHHDVVARLHAEVAETRSLLYFEEQYSSKQPSMLCFG